MAAISQKEYLKKYLSGKKDGPKKKKRPKAIGNGIKIIDVEYDLSKMRSLQEDELDIYGYSEDAPQIAGVIDDRPEDVIKAETFVTNKWKVINQDDGFNSSITIEQSKNKKNLPDGMNSNNSDSDLSPPRSSNTKSNDNKNTDKHKSRKHKKSSKKQSSDSDLSPPRKKKHDSDSDLSPPRIKKHNDDSDLSPPRKKKHESDSDLSPPRKKKQNSDSDLSPPRQKHKSNKNNSDSDLSPERNRTSNYTSKHSSRHEKKDRNRDYVPSERRERDYRDRRQNQSRNNEPRRKSRWDNDDRRNDDNDKKPRDDERTQSRDQRPEKATKTLEGKNAGLQDASQLRSENADMRKKENELFGKLSEELTGRNAQAIKRNVRRGKEETEEDIAKKKEQEAKQKVLDEKYTRWGKGLKQVEEHETRVQEYMHEASKPFARYQDDQDLDRTLKDRERIGDPMLEYMKRKEQEKAINNGEEVRPIYQGAYPINRFNIRPGHRWDGVDRSTGYEKSYFEAKNNRKAQEEENYKWSVEDM